MFFYHLIVKGSSNIFIKERGGWVDLILTKLSLDYLPCSPALISDSRRINAAQIPFVSQLLEISSPPSAIPPPSPPLPSPPPPPTSPPPPPAPPAAEGL